MPPKADQGGIGNKEKGDDEGHLVVMLSSFSSDAPAFGEDPKQMSLDNHTGIGPGASPALMHAGGARWRGRVLLRRIRWQTLQWMGTGSRNCSQISGSSQRRSLRTTSRRYATGRGGGAGHDRTISEDQSARALCGQGDHPTQGAA